MKCEYEPDFQREVIYVNKVYNECSIIDCPTYRIPIPPTYPLAVNIVDCAITNIVAEGVIVGNDEIDVVVNFVMNVEYDSNGTSQFIQQTAQYRRRGVRLEGAVPGMNVVILPLVRCLSCRAVDGGTVIECDVGIYLIVKAVALVQLEVLGRFAPEPPECEQVSPLVAQNGSSWPNLVRFGLRFLHSRSESIGKESPSPAPSWIWLFQKWGQP